MGQITLKAVDRSKSNEVLPFGAISFNTETGMYKIGDGHTLLSSLTEHGDIGDTVDAAIADLVGGAPGALNTLNELAAALGDDSNFATTILNDLAGKQNVGTSVAKAGDTLTGLLVGPGFVTVAPPSGNSATDTAAIQAAVNALPALGGKVILSKGTYRINAPIVLKTSVAFVGQGRYATTILNEANTTAIYSSTATGTRRIYIADLRIDDNLSALLRTAGNGIHVDGGADAAIVDIERVHVQGHYDGVRIDSSITSTFTSVRCNAAQHDGFAIYGLGTSISFRACYANGSVRHGYYSDGLQAYCSFVGTASDSNGGDGYHGDSGATKCAAFSFISAGSELSGGHAFYFKDAISLTFTSISGSTAVGDGLRLDGCRSVVINAPRLVSNTGYGLNILTSSTPIVPSDINLIGKSTILSNTAGQINDPTAVLTTGTPMQPRWKGGQYYGPEGIHSTAAQGLSVVSLAPLWVPIGSTVTKICAEVTTAGATGSVVRLGIYADDGTGTPGKLILDAGTIDGTSQTPQEITINQFLSGGLYWLAAAAQVATCTLRTIGSSARVPVGTASLASLFGANAASVGYYKTGVTGAFQDPLGAVTAATNNPYKVGVKAG